MPKKIRELIKKLEKSGLLNRGGQGSHHNFLYEGRFPITISGKPGDDAKKYQERAVEKTIKEINNEGV